LLGNGFANISIAEDITVALQGLGNDIIDTKQITAGKGSYALHSLSS
jgi:hypothetical protein